MLPFVAAVCVIFAVTAVVQVRAINSAVRELEQARADRREAEDIARAVDLIEDAGWRNVSNDGRFALDGETARDGLLTGTRAVTFYSRRAALGDSTERRLARRVVRLAERGQAMIELASTATGRPANRAVIAQLARFSTARTNTTGDWFDENDRIVTMAEERRRTHTRILGGLLLLGMLTLGAAVVAVRLRVTRQRDQAMRELQRTAQEMTALACTDPLTGLSNQREFHAELARQLGHVGETGESTALALIDVDNFKRINDDHGHLVGDHVLAEIGRRIDAHAAPSRLHSARIGGEEFALIMPGADRERSLRISEQLRAAMEVAIPPVGVVTVSIGVAVAMCEEGSRNLFRDADAALYTAKRTGRNRVVFADPQLERTRGSVDAEADSTFDALRALVSLVDSSQAIDGHSERVARYAARLARQAGWAPAEVARLRQSALLHDVGKVTVPPGILLKPGELSEGERSLVSSHSAVGSEMVRRALDPDQAAWVLHHHERWDGGGYPDGLMAEQIPEGARILAIADAWDAMTSKRVFAPALSIDEALAELNACRGSQFWPHGIDLMIEATIAGAGKASLA